VSLICSVYVSSLNELPFASNPPAALEIVILPFASEDTDVAPLPVILIAEASFAPAPVVLITALLLFAVVLRPTEAASGIMPYKTDPSIEKLVVTSSKSVPASFIRLGLYFFCFKVTVYSK
jgi:hypothetical protein